MHEGLTYRCGICNTINYAEETCRYTFKWWHPFYKYFEWIRNLRDNI